jgi:hypothetical protein
LGTHNRNLIYGTFHIIIKINTGPQFITGSTRMKAGTATKMVLNMISTTTMIQVGKVYDNLMIDLMAVNEKLIDRGTRIIIQLTGVDYQLANSINHKDVDVVIVSHLVNTDHLNCNEDFYFADIPKYLVDNKINPLVILINHTDEKTENFIEDDINNAADNPVAINSVSSITTKLKENIATLSSRC